MKHRKNTDGGKQPIRWIGATAGILVVGLFVLTLVTGISEGQGLGGWGNDDEGGGTLPFIGGPPPTPDDHGSLDDRPSFYLQGPIQVVLGAVAASPGGDKSFERVKSSGSEGDLLRVVYHGRVDLALDAWLFQEPRVTAGLKYGTAFGDAKAAIVFKDRIVEFAVMAPESVLPVPFAELQNRRVLGDGLQFFSANLLGQKNLVTVETFPGIVEIHQVEAGH